MSAGIVVIFCLLISLIVSVGLGYKNKDKLQDVLSKKSSDKKSSDSSSSDSSSSPSGVSRSSTQSTESPTTSESTELGNKSEKEPCRTGEWANEGECVDGKQKQTRSVTGDCGDDILGEKEIECCSIGEWKNEGACRRLVGSEFPDTASQKQVRTLVGNCPSHKKSEQEVPCCLVELQRVWNATDRKWEEKEWKEISGCTFGNKKVEKRRLFGTCPVEEWPTTRDVDCSYDVPNCAAADTHASCPGYARTKLCDSNDYWVWTQTNCATSCQRTGEVEKYYKPEACKAPDASTFCTDTYTDCEARKAKGECDTDWNTWNNCKKTCEAWGCQSSRFGTHKPDDDYWYTSSAGIWYVWNKPVQSLLPNWCMDKRYCNIQDRSGYDGPGKDTIKPGKYYKDEWIEELN